MLVNYFILAWRNLLKSKGYSAINIGGLAVGMAVAMMIGMWIWDEVNYNKFHKNHSRIARVMQNQTYNGQVSSQFSNPAVLSQEIRNKYGADFKHVIQSSWNFQHTLAVGEKKLLQAGAFMEPGVTDMLTFNIQRQG